MMAADTDWNIVPLEGVSITEDLAARLFTERYKGQLVFCHSRGVWYEFKGSTWVKQDTPMAFDAIRNMCRGMVLTNPGAATSLSKVKFVMAVETFTKTDPVMARSHADWNKDRYLLGTPGGTVDLKTGDLRASNSRDMINRSTAVSPDDFEECPLWSKFLDDATGGDEGLQRFLQQIAGYCLTGDTSEQCLFFIHGEGGRGKGVFLNTLRAIQGTYAITSAMDTFESKPNQGHSTSIAMLNGARMATASETEEGRAWADARIKLFTGQDPITARFMRRDDITFDPEFKLVIIGNHQPTLKTVDEAMRRRFNMIPFTIKPKRKDQNLQEKLKAEWPGILRWAINGCLDWQKHGLIRPEVVLRATAAYFEEQDVMGSWLRDNCEVNVEDEYLTSSATELFRSWSNYCKAAGEQPGSQKTFAQSMRREHFGSKRTSMGIFYTGVKLRGGAQDRDPDLTF